MFPKFKNQADIPEQFRELYHEVDGEWVVKEAPADDAAELKKTLKKEREAREAAEKALKDEKKRKEQEEKDAERKSKGVSEEQLKKIREEVKAEVVAEYAPQLQKLTELEADNRSLRLDTKVKAIMAEAGVKSAHTNDLWKLIGDRFDLTTDGVPMLKDTPGTDVKKYLADAVKKEYGVFYEGTKAAGSGAAGAGGTGTAAKAGDAAATGGIDVLANPGAALAAARAAGAKE